MPRLAHRARRRASRRRVPTAVGVVLVVLLGVTSITAARLMDRDGPRSGAADVGAASAELTVPSADAQPTRTAATSSPAVELTMPKTNYAELLARKAADVAARAAAREAARVAALEKARKAEIAARKASQSAPFDVRIGTFNVLGSQHTAPGGDRSRFPPATVRSVGAANLIAEHGVEIVGTQELQEDQLRALQYRTGLAAYPGLAWGTAETDNSILYDADRFELVSGSQFIIPFMGRPRPQPIVRLKDRETGREFYVVNTHPSAHGGRYLIERRRGQATLVSIVNELKSSGLPVLVTGDMNDREEFYCRVVQPAGLLAPNGGSYTSGCRPPPSPLPVDWVVGSGATWSGYWRDTTPVTKRISDHFFVSATAHVG